MGRGVLRRDRPGRAGARRRGTRDEFRPTLARVREALFNSLGARVAGMRVLDLYAGSGALGLAALERGAAHALFVDRDARLVEDLRRRLAARGFGMQAEVWRRDVLPAVREIGGTGRQFDLIVMDPPYGQRLLTPTLQAVQAAGLLAPGGWVVAEGHWRDRPEPVAGLVLRREAKYGETVLWYFERAGGDGS